MSTEDLNSLVYYGDILAAARAVHGGQVQITNYNVERATKSVQGFTSLMLRVRANLNLNGKEISTNFIVKRLPLMEEQQKLVGDLDVFEREVFYFTKIVPRFNRPAPLVTCHLVYGNTLVMEDLCVSGYESLVTDMRQIVLKDQPVSFARMIMRKYAQLHAASVDCNWDEYAYVFAKDPLLENDVFKTMFANFTKSITVIIKHLYPDEKQHMKYVSFLLNNSYDKIVQFALPVPNGVNVICQGDCHINNMMFKLDPVTKEPLDLKFIDLQIFRRTHPSRDIVHFLHLGFSHSFLQKYELELIELYVNAFNTFVCQTPDLFTLDEFMKEYERVKLYGKLMANIMRPAVLMENMFPHEGEELTPEMVESLFQTDHSKNTIAEFNNNELYRTECTTSIKDLMAFIDGLEEL